MSREIKFRAWHKNANHMCMNVTTDLLNRDYLVFMQYTGLKDKNGKEIYEGDILINTNKSKLNLGIENQKYLIIYRALGFDLKPLFKGMALKFNYTDLELIGNIYENPELLEGEE
ncbi:TPA: DNA-packaging protein [Clostridium perfringens]|nr:DNA-packaging protein [Clostridium perfringens]